MGFFKISDAEEYQNAVSFESGVGVEKNKKAATEHHQKAADAEALKEQLLIANRYYNGDGVPKDLKMAEAYYKKAAYREIPEGMYGYGQCQYIRYVVEGGSPFSFDLDGGPFYWFKKAADAGYAPAMTALARCYFEDCDQVEFFLDKDRYEAALKWAKKAIEHGDKTAGVMLDKCERAIKQIELNEKKRMATASTHTSSGLSDSGLSVDPREYVKANLPSVWSSAGRERVENDPNLSETDKEAILNAYRIYSD